MIKKLITYTSRINRGLLDIAGFALLVSAVYLELGLSPALAATGGALFVFRYLMD